MRAMNVPMITDPSLPSAVPMVWPIYDCCYPKFIAAGLNITTHPDPFSPSGNRVCHHAMVEIVGLGVVDLGWCVTGEPPPDCPIVAVCVDPNFVVGTVEGFHFTPGPTRPAGRGMVDTMYRRLQHVIVLTMLGIAVQVVKDSTKHRATEHFFQASLLAQYHACGMLRRWNSFSPIDLCRVELL